MWKCKLNKQYKLNDKQYLAWVIPDKWSGDTLEEFTKSCKIDAGHLYRLAQWTFEINDLVVATSLTEPRLAKFDKEGYFTVILEKRQYCSDYENTKLVYKNWLKYHHKSEDDATSYTVLETLYQSYARMLFPYLGITKAKFGSLVYNRGLTEYNYVENPIDESISPFEFILKSFK